MRHFIILFISVNKTIIYKIYAGIIKYAYTFAWHLLYLFSHSIFCYSLYLIRYLSQTINSHLSAIS